MQRSNSASGSNGQARVETVMQEETEQSVNGFNTAEVKVFLGREVGLAPYKPGEAGGGSRSSGGAWGSKREYTLRHCSCCFSRLTRNTANHMANNQPFFAQLAKQIATLEGGG